MTDIHDEAAGRAMVARTEFTKESVWLPLLAVNHMNAGQGVITGKTFTECVIEGPAVMIAISNLSLEGCNLGVTTNPKNLLYKPLGEIIVGGIGFSDCRFVNCRFVQVGFTGSDEFLDDLAKGLSSAAAETGAGA